MSEIIPPSNRFYCTKCDTDFEVIAVFNSPQWSAFCPYCDNLVKKQPVCGSCHQALGKKSKGIKCGFCGSKFTNTERFKHYLQTTKEKEGQS